MITSAFVCARPSITPIVRHVNCVRLSLEARRQDHRESAPAEAEARGASFADEVGSHAVTAGGPRLKVLREPAAEGVIPTDYRVPVHRKSSPGA